MPLYLARDLKADLARTVLAVPLGHCSAGFGFLQDRQKLAVAEPDCRHRKVLSW